MDKALGQISTPILKPDAAAATIFPAFLKRDGAELESLEASWPACLLFAAVTTDFNQVETEDQQLRLSTDFYMCTVAQAHTHIHTQRNHTCMLYTGTACTHTKIINVSGYISLISLEHSRCQDSQRSPTWSSKHWYQVWGLCSRAARANVYSRLSHKCSVPWFHFLSFSFCLSLTLSVACF